MPLDTLRQFIDAIDAAGELVRVSHPVCARLELCEIADRAMKMPGGGPALLFEHVILDDGQRSAYPVGINLYGSMKRMAMALGVERLADHGARISTLLDLKVPWGILGKLSLLPRLMELTKFPPRTTTSPICQEIVCRAHELNLARRPITPAWPQPRR